MTPSGEVPADLLSGIDELLAATDAELSAAAAPAWTRQPVHTVYVPADRFDAGTVSAWGRAALTVLDTAGPLPGGLAALTDDVRAKLVREPVEDLRIDLEDGYGHRPATEDDDVRAAARALGELAGSGHAPLCSGIRVKSMEAATRGRGLRSLALFVGELVARGTGIPDGFRVTLPKVSTPEQVSAFVVVLGRLEQLHGLGELTVEVQVETPRAVLFTDGRSPLPAILAVLGTRCGGLHFGTYDYTAALGIAAADQALDHPAADAAKDVLQLAAAAVGARVSDGSTNVLPVGSVEQVRGAWALHARLVTRALHRGLYQGWDLHPAQLPTRFAATFAYYRAGLPAAAQRLRAHTERRSTGVLDEPATVRALAGFVLRAVDAGAVTPADAARQTGLDPAVLQGLLVTGGAPPP